MKNIKEIENKFKSAKFGSGSEEADKYSINKDLSIYLSENFSNEKLSDLKQVLSKYKGSNKVFFGITSNGKKKIIKTDFQVNNTSYLITELKAKLGDSISIQ